MRCDTIISILPNDDVLTSVSTELLKDSSHTTNFTHISCSTVSPTTSRGLQKIYANAGKTLIASPVFARPDGIARKEATWMIAGDPKGRLLATTLLSSGDSLSCSLILSVYFYRESMNIVLSPYLSLGGKVIDYGDDIGAANIVKLCGNFLIASSIESIAEAMALAEKHGVDRTSVMKLLSSTIFDCLIYKGYGQRVSERDHKPGGFSLSLGLKDVSLVRRAAQDADVPMPFLSTLIDRFYRSIYLLPSLYPHMHRFTSAKAKGRHDMDWSAIGMSVAEDAGIDITKDLAKNFDNLRNSNSK